MTDLRETVRDAIAALRVAAEKARQSEASDRKWEGEYDLLTHHAEMLEGVLAGSGGALVVTDAMVSTAWDTLMDQADADGNIGADRAIRAALTAGLPLAKTEAEVRADERERLAKLAEKSAEEIFSDVGAYIQESGQGEHITSLEVTHQWQGRVNWLRSQAGGGE